METSQSARIGRKLLDSALRGIDGKTESAAQHPGAPDVILMFVGDDQPVQFLGSNGCSSQPTGYLPSAQTCIHKDPGLWAADED
jgi:hypothetical protein